MLAPWAHVRCSSLPLSMTLVLRSSREPPVASGFSFVDWGPPSAGSVTCFCFNTLVSRWRPVNCSFLRNWRKTLSPSLIQIEAACRAEQRKGRPASRQLLRYEHGESDERRGCVLRRTRETSKATQYEGGISWQPGVARGGSHSAKRSRTTFHFGCVAGGWTA